MATAARGIRYLALFCATCAAFNPQLAHTRLAHSRLPLQKTHAPRHPHPVLREYSTKVKITVESKAPFRQARIFFIYPATLAGAAVALYVSITRLIAGLGGFRDDLTPLNDAGNLLVDAGVIAAAVWLLRADLRAREEQLEQVAAQLEGPPKKAKDKDDDDD